MQFVVRKVAKVELNSTSAAVARNVLKITLCVQTLKWINISTVA